MRLRRAVGIASGLVWRLVKLIVPQTMHGGLNPGLRAVDSLVHSRTGGSTKDEEVEVKLRSDQGGKSISTRSANPDWVQDDRSLQDPIHDWATI